MKYIVFMVLLGLFVGCGPTAPVGNYKFEVPTIETTRISPIPFNIRWNYTTIKESCVYDGDIEGMGATKSLNKYR